MMTLPRNPRPSRLPFQLLAFVSSLALACDAPTTGVDGASGPVSLSVSPAVLEIRNGETGVLSAELVDVAGRSVSATSLEWTSLQPGIASVTSGGRVQGLHPGEATIRVALPEHEAISEAVVIVRPVADDILFVVPDEVHVGTAGQALADSLEVRVVDEGGLPVPDVAVAFEVEEGGGSVSPTVAVSGADGYARAEWTLGPKAGPNAVAVSPERAAAPAGAAAGAGKPDHSRKELHGWGRPGQPARIDVTPEMDTLKVEEVTRLDAVVRDRWGNVIEDAAVSWSSSDASVATVGSEGTVQGRSDGETEITATASAPAGVGPASAPPESVRGRARVLVVRSGTTSLVRTGGNGQEAPAGDPLADPLVVRVVDSAGAGLGGIRVEWAVSAGGGSLAVVDPSTDAQGYARASWTLGVPLGTQEVTAWTEGTGAVHFTATAVIGPASEVTVTPGSASIETGATTQLSAYAYDRVGHQITERPVEWSTRDASVAWADAGGSVTGVSDGTTRIVASLDGASGEAEVTVVGEPPPAAPVASLLSVSPATATLEVGETAQFTSDLRDQYGNPFQGTVTWEATGGTITADGLYTAGDAAGDFRVVAHGPNDLTDDAAVQVTPPPPPPPVASSLVLTPDAAALETGETVQFSAALRDQYGDPFDGSVTWEATGGSISGTGLYTAGEEAGSFEVVAHGPEGLIDRAAVEVSSPTPPPPVATTLAVSPTTTSVEAGGTVQFSADLRDQYGDPFDGSVSWSATGGAITGDGRYTAGSLAGSFSVTASHDGLEASATVQIASSDGPPSMDRRTLLFSDDFEAGNHDVWSTVDPVDEMNFVSTERPFRGVRSGKFFGIGKSHPWTSQYGLSDKQRTMIKLLEWGPFDDGAYYLSSAWYYWPTDYDVHPMPRHQQYVNIMQWKERNSPWDPLWVLAVDGSQGYDRFVLHDWHGQMTGQNFHEPSPNVHVPKGRWFNLTVLYRPHKENGTVEVWMDGEPILSLEGVPTMKESASTNAIMWGVGNYGWPSIGQDWDTPNGIFIDDVEVWRVEN